MSKQIRQRLQIIEDRFGKMALRDMIHVDGGPDTPIHKAAHSGDHDSLKVRSANIGRLRLRDQKGTSFVRRPNTKRLVLPLTVVSLSVV